MPWIAATAALAGAAYTNETNQDIANSANQFNAAQLDEHYKPSDEVA